MELPILRGGMWLIAVEQPWGSSQQWCGQVVKIVRTLCRAGRLWQHMCEGIIKECWSNHGLDKGAYRTLSGGLHTQYSLEFLASDNETYVGAVISKAGDKRASVKLYQMFYSLPGTCFGYISFNTGLFVLHCSTPWLVSTNCCV